MITLHLIYNSILQNQNYTLLYNILTALQDYWTSKTCVASSTTV